MKMKTGKHLIFLVALQLFFFPVNAQIFGNDPEIKIDNLSPEYVWQVAEMALTEKGFGTGKFDPAGGSLYSDWLEWTAIAVSNRARLYFTYEGTTLTLRIVDRQYKSNEGWSEAVGNLSKKKYTEYIQAVADRINEINADPKLIRQAVKSSKLIPAFVAINKVGETEWKLLEVIQQEIGGQFRPAMKFQVTNKGLATVSLLQLTGAFERISGGGTARLVIQWDQSSGDNPKQATIRPGEMTFATLSVGQGYSLSSGVGFVMQNRFDYNDGQKSRWETLVMYNVPIPYTYQEGD